MKKIALFSFLVIAFTYSFGQAITGYNIKEVMIPMRDGIKLYTVIFTPKESTVPLPILIQRTPYGASVNAEYNSSACFTTAPSLPNLAK